jgi:hypothetical protein
MDATGRVGRPSVTIFAAGGAEISAVGEGEGGDSGRPTAGRWENWWPMASSADVGILGKRRLQPTLESEEFLQRAQTHDGFDVECPPA